jgi:hypothetical protein
MQFSPYRIQLAGIRTAEVDYRPLLRPVVLLGTVTRAETVFALVQAEAFEKDLPWLSRGRPIQANSDLLPGHLPFVGEVEAVDAEASSAGHSFRVRLKVRDPERELPSGTLVTARLEGAVLQLPWWRQAAAQQWRDRTTIELAVRALATPALPAVPSGVESLLGGAVAEALASKGLGLAAPQSAVIDHGSRKVAFVECGPGMFDAVEVTLGPRCGDFYPVLSGLFPGQRVAVAVAFLLDAEMWLNHGLAAGYFGASRGASAAPPGPAPNQTPGALSPADLLLVARQKTCPVTDQPLESMGGPVRVEVAGQIVFVCCQGCEEPLRKAPQKFLAKVPTK